MRGEVANQDLHFPMFLPKVPGRFYYYFGKPIETEGMAVRYTDYLLCNIICDGYLVSLSRHKVIASFY